MKLLVLLLVLLLPSLANAQCTPEMLDVVVDFGAEADGLNEDRTEIMAAQTAAVAGDTICFPAGTYLIDGSQIVINKSNITWLGMGSSSVIHRTTTNSATFVTTASPANQTNVTFRNLRFTFGAGASGQAHALRLTNGITNVTVDGIEVIDPPAYGVHTSAASGLVVKNSLFLSRTFVGHGINFDTSPTSATITGNVFYGLEDGILVDTGTSGENPASGLVVENNRFDLAWYLGKSLYGNSGGTVTYTSNTVVDSAATFTGLGLGSGASDVSNNIRVMAVKRSGTLAYKTGYKKSRRPPFRKKPYTNTYTVVDSGGNFVSAGVLRGELIRSGTSFAVVSTVRSATEVDIEEWRDQTTYLPVAAPASGTAYTLYGIVIGQIKTVTNNTSLSVTGWGDWFNLEGDRVTPSNGTRFEVLTRRPNYPLHMEAGTSGTIVRNNYLMRGWSDQISMWGTASTVTGNYVERGEDMGITLHGANNLVDSNTVRWHGAGGIWTTASGTTTISNNSVQNSKWVNNSNSNLGDVVLFNADGVDLISNALSSPDSPANYGVIIRGDGASNVSENILLRNNVASNHVTADYGTVDTSSGVVQNVTWENNTGTCAGNDCP